MSGLLNYRKLRQDFSSAFLKEGRLLHDAKAVCSVQILDVTDKAIRLKCEVWGNYNNRQTGEIEIDRQNSEIVESICNCSEKYDCQHLAATLFYLEEHLDSLISGSASAAALVSSSRQQEDVRKSDLRVDRELVREYVEALLILSFNPLCLPTCSVDSFQPLSIDFLISIGQKRLFVGFSEEVFFEIQLTLRIPGRSKPLQIVQAQEFIDAVKYQDVVTFNGRQVALSKECFTEDSWKILRIISEQLVMLSDSKVSVEGAKRVVPKKSFIGIESVSQILCEQRAIFVKRSQSSVPGEKMDFSLIFTHGMEAPFRFSVDPVEVTLELDAMQSPAPKLVLKVLLDLGETRVNLQDVTLLLKSSPPGLLFNCVYYAFRDEVMSAHLRRIEQLDNLVIPEPLCGTFLEHVLPEMRKILRIDNEELVKQFTTYSYKGEVRGICNVFYVGGKLEVQFSFLYGDLEVPESVSMLTVDIVRKFISKDGILARSLSQERALVNDMFHHFIFDSETSLFLAKNERALLYFMTEVIPKYRGRVEFRCPDNLLDQFIYDTTTFRVGLYEGVIPGQYEAHIEVNGHLSGLSLERLWECVLYERKYVDLVSSDRRSAGKKIKRVLVLDLKRLVEVIHFFDDLGVKKLETGVFHVPFWTLAQINPNERINDLIELTIDENLLALQREMSDFHLSESVVISRDIKAVFRSYQDEGIVWLERLRKMHLESQDCQVAQFS
ncbi:SNF2 helicase associated domain-containing protein [Candidatus Similichlamydia epinepheli]|uniref:SNF2 helicase associated domain-containing protein n=1 Tax=Candidatus Similichlamydia epinepheli TaxID=1903953 RepID=UPI000D3A7921|nr:SNF2 helicase associated domain-containing protein [Candidatus Similichlamydia epinepheli]